MKNLLIALTLIASTTITGCQSQPEINPELKESLLTAKAGIGMIEEAVAQNNPGVCQPLAKATLETLEESSAIAETDVELLVVSGVTKEFVSTLKTCTALVN